MLEGKSFFLRTVREGDLPKLFFYLDSIRLKGEYLPSALLSERHFQQEFLETGFWGEEKGTVLIVSKERILGAIWFEKHQRFDSLDLFYYIFLPEDRGKNLMSQALALFCPYLFATQKIQRLQIFVPGYSKAAIRVAQKTGFQFEGIAREAFFHRGQYQDLCLYSLLRTEAKGIEKIYAYPQL